MLQLLRWIDRHPLAATVPLLVGVGICAALDPWVLRHAHWPRWEGADLYRLLRVSGFLGTWLGAAAVLVLLRSGSGVARRHGDALEPVAAPSVGVASAAGWRAGAWLLFAAAAAGGAAAAIKPLVRRLRPDPQGDYALAFRPWADRPFDGGGLSFPSEHAAVAFAACFVLCRLYPRAWPIWLAWAGGCALTRLTQRAHFLSDVYVAMLLGLLACAMLGRWFDASAKTAAAGAVPTAREDGRAGA